MNRYIWTLVTLLLINVNASENPFALKENLQKIDQEQDMLLMELSQLAQARDEIDEVDEETTVQQQEQPIKSSDDEEEYDAANAIDELVGDSEQPKVKNATPSQETEMTEVQRAIKEAQAREEERKAVAAYEKQRAEKLALEAKAAAEAKAAQEKAAALKAEKEAQVSEEERKAVAAYEKQRAEKLAREAKAKQEAQAEIAKIDVEAEKKAASAAADVGYSKAVQEMGGESAQEAPKRVVQVETSPKPTQKTEMSAQDIDVEAEKLAAKEAADAAYLAAVKEMDQEEEY